jgi:hypothetical protein
MAKKRSDCLEVLILYISILKVLHLRNAFGDSSISSISESEEDVHENSLLSFKTITIFTIILPFLPFGETRYT